MARFDVYRYSDAVPLVIDVQAGLLAALKTRVVIPLLPLSRARQEVVPRLKPAVDVKGKSYVLMTTDIAAVNVAGFGDLIENLEPQRQVIIDAIDFLLQGF